MGKVKVQRGILYAKNRKGDRKGFDNLEDALRAEAECCGIDCCENLIRLNDQVTGESFTIAIRSGVLVLTNEATGDIDNADLTDQNFCVPDPYLGRTYTPSYDCVTGFVMGGSAGNLTGVTMAISATPLVVTDALTAGSKVITLTHTASGCVKTLPAFIVQQCYSCVSDDCVVTPGNKGAGAFASEALCEASDCE